MKEFFSVLTRSTLFQTFDEEKLISLLKKLDAYVKHYSKNDVIRQEGAEFTETGIVISGMAHIAKIDIDGNKNLIMELKPGQSFGETIAFSETKHSPVSIMAATNCMVIFLPAKKILDFCCSQGADNIQFTKNIIKFMAEKSIMLHIKNDILAQKSLRAKLQSFFYYETAAFKNTTIRIPFSREALADYLCVNASALSRELGKLRDEGLLSFKKDKFTLSTGLEKE